MPEVRLVGENIEGGVYPTRKALEIAEELELDLVEISPNATPPVCKVIDYKKFLYEQKKRDKEMKAKATKVVIKEIRFGPQTDDHDYEFKKKHGEKFLKEGSKVKASKGVLSSIKTKAKYYYCAWLPTLRTMVRWSKCLSSKANV